jgi:hypothetical protein
MEGSSIHFKSWKNIKVVLPYRCATNNETYTELDKSCDFILYESAYYHQENNAYGFSVKVHPLNAWIAL